jgi:hypothetical protein
LQLAKGGAGESCTVRVIWRQMPRFAPFEEIDSQASGEIA